VVLPVDIGNAFIERATAMGWHLRLRTDVAETELRPPHRVLLAFSPTAGSVSATGFRGPEQQYSEGFTALTEDFYLFM
jgi:tRNA1Val (adenine37-N6)-methyltransferase